MGISNNVLQIMAFPREQYRYKDKYINTTANMNLFLNLLWLVLFVGLLFSLLGQLSLESNGQIILTTTTLLSLVPRMEEKTNLIEMLCRWRRSSTTSRGSSTTRTRMSRWWCSTSTTVIAGAHQLTLYLGETTEGSCPNPNYFCLQIAMDSPDLKIATQCATVLMALP